MPTVNIGCLKALISNIGCSRDNCRFPNKNNDINPIINILTTIDIFVVLAELTEYIMHAKAILDNIIDK